MLRENLKRHLGDKALESKVYKWEPKEQAIWRHVGGNTALFEELYSAVQSNAFVHMEDTHVLTCMDS